MSKPRLLSSDRAFEVFAHPLNGFRQTSSEANSAASLMRLSPPRCT